MAFILTVAGICLLLAAFGIFTDYRTGSGWDIPAGLKMPMVIGLVITGVLCIYADLQHWWREKNYLALAAYPGLAILVIFIVVRQL